MFFAQNIKFLRKRRNRSQQVLADFLDIKRTTLSSYENGSAEPKYQALLKFADYFGFGADVLLRSNLEECGEFELSELEKMQNSFLNGGTLRILATTVDQDNEENIELVPEKAKAGYSTGYSDPEFIKILPTFQLPFLSKSKKYRTFQISGDSMPPIPEGAMVTGEYIQNWSTIRNGYPYIVVTKDDGVVFKNVHSFVEENGQLQLCSTNPIYDPYFVSVNSVLEIWKFVNYISTEIPDPAAKRDELTKSVLGLQKQVSQMKNYFREYKKEGEA